MATALTKSNWILILRWIPELIGLIMNGIYVMISSIGIPNVGLAIILLTIVFYIAMTPLQIKQQRFTRLNNLMQPELQKIQAKYKGKKDQVSQQKQMDETNAVYEKYGVSPAGSCVQLIIQMPILFALYQVIYKVPGYISQIGNRIAVLAEDAEFVTYIKGFVENAGDANLTRALLEGETENIIDTVYKLNSTQWATVLSETVGKGFADTLASVHEYISKATYFLGLNISDSPWNIMQSSWSGKHWGLMIGAILIPVLAWGSQVLNTKLMTGGNENRNNNSGSSMDATMKSMNTTMPLMSAFFCATLPVGIGIYWIAGAVVRTVQMLIINKIIERESPEEIVKKAQEKAAKKRAKQGLPPQKIVNSAHLSTRSLAADEEEKAAKRATLAEKANRQMKESTEYYNKNAKAGSIASKANMVRQYEEKKIVKKK